MPSLRDALTAWPSAASGCCSGRPPRTRRLIKPHAPSGRWRAGNGRAASLAAWSWPPACLRQPPARTGLAVPPLLAAWVLSPRSPTGSAGRSPPAADAPGRGAALPAAPAGPAHLALLRAFRRPGRPLAAARPFPGAPARPGGPPDLAHQHRPDAALHPGRLRPGLRRPLGLVSACATPWTRWIGWSATAAISSTGTTRARSQPLPPRYVSTVDSGNLAGCLLALRQGCLEAAGPPRAALAALAGPAGHPRRARRDDAGARPGRR